MIQEFGDTCKCGHSENRHESVKASVNMPNNLIGITNLHPLLNMTISYDTNCKICNCTNFKQ